MTKLRKDPPRVAREFFQPAEPFSDKAEPKQDRRREQLDKADELPPIKVEPKPVPIDQLPEPDRSPLPYVERPRTKPGTIVDDGFARSLTVTSTTSTELLGADPLRRRVILNSTGPVRVSIGPDAVENLASSMTTFLYDGSVAGLLVLETGAAIAVKADTGDEEVSAIVERIRG